MNVLIYVAFITFLTVGAFIAGYSLCYQNYDLTVEVVDTTIADGEFSMKYFWDYYPKERHVVVSLGKFRDEPRVIKGHLHMFEYK